MLLFRFSKKVRNIYPRGIFVYSDHFSKIFSTEDRSNDIHDPGRGTLTTRLSWIKECCETLANRLTWLNERCECLMLKILRALLMSSELSRTKFNWGKLIGLFFHTRWLIFSLKFIACQYIIKKKNIREQFMDSQGFALWSKQSCFKYVASSFLLFYIKFLSCSPVTKANIKVKVNKNISTYSITWPSLTFNAQKWWDNYRRI